MKAGPTRQKSPPPLINEPNLIRANRHKFSLSLKKYANKVKGKNPPIGR
jgi:hypothetical protein